MEYFACVLTEEELMAKAHTSKRITCSLDNISILDDNEYISLYSWCVYESSATNMPWRYTGVCYLLLLHERDRVRFKKCFSRAFYNTYKSIDDGEFCDDYYDLEPLLWLCDPDVYKEFLEIACKSGNEDIKQDAQKWLLNHPVIDSRYCIAIKAEYNEFKRKLDS